MEHYTFDKKNGLWYKLEGDYYISCVAAPDVKYTGIWGERRRRYLQQHQQSIYTGMLLDDTLEAHLQKINTQAEAMFDGLVGAMAYSEDISEHMKADKPTEWVAHMNNIRSRAMEIVNSELIYA